MSKPKGGATSSPPPKPRTASSAATKPSPKPKPTAASKPPPHKSPPAKKVTQPKNKSQNNPLTNEQIRNLPVGADSRDALVKATGGRVERIGRRSLDNAFSLVLWDRRFLYTRVQDKSSERETSYNTGTLKKAIAPEATQTGKDLDHVASTGVEGRRMGNRFSLVGLVDKSVNRSHGATSEKGAAPTREAAKAFGGGLDQKGKDHVSYMTKEQADKLANKPSTGNKRNTLKEPIREADRRKISDSLLQGQASQERLKSLSKEQTPALANRIVSSRALKGRSR